MVDTLGIGVTAPTVGPLEVATFARACAGPLDCRAVQDADEPPRVVAWSGRIPGLGRLTLNADGYVRHEQSLPKTWQLLAEEPDKTETELNNVELLSAAEVNVAVQTLLEKVEKVLPFVDMETWRVTRADISYQRPVRSSTTTLRALQSAIVPTRCGAAWFDNRAGVPTGLMLRGKSVAHRVYDKGLESLIPKYNNVLRSEEQLRRGSKGLESILDIEQRCFKREECVRVMNERYLDVAYSGELDVSELVKQGNHTVALLALHPELMPVYRQSVKKNGYYKMQRKVREYRASAVPEDLRLPEDAWTE